MYLNAYLTLFTYISCNTCFLINKRLVSKYLPDTIYMILVKRDACAMILVTWHLCHDTCYLTLKTWNLLPDHCFPILISQYLLSDDCYLILVTITCNITLLLTDICYFSFVCTIKGFSIDPACEKSNSNISSFLLLLLAPWYLILNSLYPR